MISISETTIIDIKKYLDELLATSKPDAPKWNIEQILDGKKPSWNYVDGCMIKAVLDMYQITNEAKYLEFADEFIDYYIDDEGKILDYDIDELNLDHINEGKVLYTLFDLTQKAKYRKAIDTLYEQIKVQPRTKEGNFWHKNIYPNQVWLDGLYMAQPFYMEYETKYNRLKNCKDVFNQFKNVESFLKNTETGLYYHAYDSSREMFWCDKETGLSKHYWGRALGWFLMAIVDTIEAMDEQMFYEYRYLMNMCKDLVEALVAVQSESGMWYQVVDLGQRQGNYLETSASSIISYAILKAVRLEIVPDKYRENALKCYQDICDRYLVNKEGKMKLGGICLVAGLGGKSKRDGSFDYYMSEPIVEDEAKGVAPFLMAFTEIYRIMVDQKDN